MILIEERQKRRTTEAAYCKRRQEVERYYNSLRSSGDYKVLPTLAEFRKIPVIRVLQSKTSDSKTTVAEELKQSPFLKDLVHDDLKKWIDTARVALSTTLGFPDWKGAGTRKLHPVARLTARFKCTKCHKVAKKYEQDGCLDFAGACGHTCPDLDKKRRAKDVWNVNQFVRDDKVS